MSEYLLSEREENGVLRLTLNDVARRNALSESMLEQLDNAMNIASQDHEVRVVILSANGPVFCAGHDLKELTKGRQETDQGHDYFQKIMTLCSGVMQSIMKSPKPVIAEVSGMATAAGCQLVASCDLAVASDNAKFCTPGVNIGLFCSTPMVALSRNISAKHAMEMLLTGEIINADRAEQIGLINRVTTDELLTETTMKMAFQIALKSSATIATGKLAFYQQREMSVSDAYDYASEIMVKNMLYQDAKEGMDAFIEKRKPQWQDK